MSILGNVAGLPAPQSDWAQTDPARGDYIKNKPALADPAVLDQALSAAQGALARTGGTMEGALNMGGHKITGLGSPQADGEAVSLGVMKAFYAGKVIPVTASLSVSGWSGNSQRVNVGGVTEGNTVIVTPAPGSWKAYGEAGVRCSAQGDGTLSFQCEETPEEALAVNILIVN